MRMAGTAESPLKPRYQILKENINKKLQAGLSDLSDLELRCLGEEPFRQQDSYLAMLRGSGATGARMFDRPRAGLVEDKLDGFVQQKELYYVCDAQLLELSRIDQQHQLKELAAMLKDPYPVAILKDKTRQHYFVDHIDPTALSDLSLLSDVALRVLGSVPIHHQRDVIKQLQKDDNILPTSREKFNRAVLPKTLRDEVPDLSDAEVYDLSQLNTDKERISAVDRLRIKFGREPTWNVVPAKARSAKKSTKDLKTAAPAPTTVMDLDDADDEDELDFTLITTARRAKNVAMNFKVSKSLIAVLVCGDLRSGNISTIVACSRNSKKRIFDMEALAKDGYNLSTSTFGNLLQSEERVKVMHDSRAASDALKKLGITLRGVFDTGVGRMVHGWDKAPTVSDTLEDVFSVYAPEVVLPAAPVKKGSQSVMDKKEMWTYAASVAAELPNVALAMMPSLETTGESFKDPDVADEDDELDFTLVTTTSQANKVGAKLRSNKSNLLAVRVCGDLCRTGKISAIVACSLKGKARVFDLEALAEDGFDLALSSLGTLLQSKQPVKVMHDCRAASDALKTHAGITLRGVFDTAVAWDMVQWDTALTVSLEDVFAEYAPRVVLPARSAANSADSPLEQRACALLEEEEQLEEGRSAMDEQEEMWTYEAVVAEELTNVALEMTPKLEKARKSFKERCDMQLEDFRSWPGQRVDHYGMGIRVPVEFIRGKLCAVDAPIPWNEEEADDAGTLLDVLPEQIVMALAMDFGHSSATFSLIAEVVLGLGRKPEVRKRSLDTGRLEVKEVGRSVVSAEDLSYVIDKIGEGSFNMQERAGIEGTLHRISRTRNLVGQTVALNMRIGRPSQRLARLLTDLISSGDSILLLGPPGVGKTTLLRGCAKVMSRTRNTVIVDPTGEIAGCGNACHPSVGRAWKDMGYSSTPLDRSGVRQLAMTRALENMMPQVLVVDEIGTQGEANAAKTIGQRGVQLLATAHGRTLQDLMGNPELHKLFGGLRPATLGDDNPRYKKTKRKSITERGGPSVFTKLVEIHSPSTVIVHEDLGRAVDKVLSKEPLSVQVRTLDADCAMYVEHQER